MRKLLFVALLASSTGCQTLGGMFSSTSNPTPAGAGPVEYTPDPLLSPDIDEQQRYGRSRYSYPDPEDRNIAPPVLRTARRPAAGRPARPVAAQVATGRRWSQRQRRAAPLHRPLRRHPGGVPERHPERRRRRVRRVHPDRLTVPRIAATTVLSATMLESAGSAGSNAAVVVNAPSLRFVTAQLAADGGPRVRSLPLTAGTRPAGR